MKKRSESEEMGSESEEIGNESEGKRKVEVGKNGKGKRGVQGDESELSRKKESSKDPGAEKKH